MSTGVFVAEIIILVFSLLLALRRKTIGQPKRLGWFLLYFLLINALAFIIAFVVDKMVVLIRR
jgi:hypothetical protein